jgi:hypothetical protein
LRTIFAHKLRYVSPPAGSTNMQSHAHRDV